MTSGYYLNSACGIEVLREGWERHFGAAGGPFRDIAQIGLPTTFRMLTTVPPHCVLYPEVRGVFLLAFLYYYLSVTLLLPGELYLLLYFIYTLLYLLYFIYTGCQLIERSQYYCFIYTGCQLIERSHYYCFIYTGCQLTERSHYYCCIYTGCQLIERSHYYCFIYTGCQLIERSHSYCFIYTGRQLIERSHYYCFIDTGPCVQLWPWAALQVFSRTAVAVGSTAGVLEYGCGRGQHCKCSRVQLWP